MKCLIVSSCIKEIIIISYLAAGSIHDYALMKKLFDPDKRWFHGTDVLLDLGFYGANKDYDKSNILMPHKKPKKSKNNPEPKLTGTQKNENKTHAKYRVVVEHAIGGMKAFNCISHRIRNHIDGLIDSFFLVSAGLWNLKIS